MIKIAIVIFNLMLLTACASHQTSTLHYNGNNVPVGIMKQEILLANFASFSSVFQRYQLTQQQQQIVNSWPENLSIDIYFGTWCHDSQREVPKLLKALQTHPTIKTRLIALDLHKTDPQGLAKNNAIEFTPTFILLLNNKEIGRIVERPRENIISDINSFLP